LIIQESDISWRYPSNVIFIVDVLST